MKNYILILGIVLNFFTSTYAQNNPIPAYLINKPFSAELLQFELINLKDEVVTLGEILKAHKGKNIVLDFWASWCRDCILDVPSSKELKKKTKHTDYVYISLDNDKERWKRAITLWDIKGDHYYINGGWENKLTKYIDLDWIPRYLVLDNTGVIIVPKALKISDKEIKESVN